MNRAAAAALAVVIVALLAGVALAKSVKTDTTLNATSGGFAGQLSSVNSKCLKGREVMGTLATREQRVQLGPVRSNKSGNWLLPATVPSEDYFLQVHVTGRSFPKSKNHLSCNGVSKLINTSAP